MKIALAQFNPTIAAIEDNTRRIIEFVARARDQSADLIVFPEQTILGYPAKDLLLRAELVQRNVAALDAIADAARGIGVLVGFAEPNPNPIGRPTYNSAALLHDGRVVANVRKRLLPTYDVFDELRYFQPAERQEVVEFGGRRLGVCICEDLLHEAVFGRTLYDADPCGDLVSGGAEILINLTASPYTTGKPPWRRERCSTTARRLGRPLVMVNQVGGNDQLIFEGGSCAFGAAGELIAHAKDCREDLLVVDFERPGTARVEPRTERLALIHDALVLGLRDYVRKCGFRKVVIGLSGGVDSALVAALACAALGAENVHGVAMPSRFSSDHSQADARRLAENLGIRYSIVPIEPMHAAFETALQDEFTGRAPDATEENLQARTRGVILMALSNKFGELLLTTGNKSELAVGYCTLYGDMCGGLAVISDVPKTLVYSLARHVNDRAGRELIPRSSIEKPPSAELRPNQRDQDSLPPYEVLDAILERYEERLDSAETIIAAGFDEAVVRDVLRRIHVNEYKRQQAAPGLKITSRAFGFGRRMPVAAEG